MERIMETKAWEERITLPTYKTGEPDKNPMFLEKRVYQLIWQGGPFPYVKDGMVFANRERLLPPKTRGFYREYTVASPHARTRGARRFVCGGPRRSPEVCYYTADHYASFQKIVP